MLNACAISCIQKTETGRELKFGKLIRASSIKRALVVGVARWYASCINCYRARAQGNIIRKIYCTRWSRKLDLLLPWRTEFGGVRTNFQGELENAQVSVHLNASVDLNLVKKIAPDIVVSATGGVPNNTEIQGAEDAHVVNARQVLKAR